MSPGAVAVSDYSFNLMLKYFTSDTEQNDNEPVYRSVMGAKSFQHSAVIKNNLRSVIPCRREMTGTLKGLPVAHQKKSSQG